MPLAAVLWNSGISFGGVIAFIFADLIVLPVLNIYRKYYGLRMTAFLAITSYAAMVIAGYAVEALFGTLGLIPAQRVAIVADPAISLNYTTVLNAALFALAAVLVVRAFRTGVLGMLATMSGPPTAAGAGRLVSATETTTGYACPMHPDRCGPLRVDARPAAWRSSPGFLPAARRPDRQPVGTRRCRAGDGQPDRFG